MILGACTGLSCYLAVASAKPNPIKSNGSSAIRHDLCCPIGGYSGVLSMSMSKRGKNTVVAGAGGASLTYRGAGVDIDAGSELVRRIAKMAPGIGGFGGFLPLDDGSYLVASMDGVGTKLMLALETGILDTIGIDLVAMSVNDVVTSGTKPLGFLDYYSTGHLDVDVAEKVIKGIVDGCKQSGCKQSDCALLGGETAEMPGLYREGDFDLCGCAVGIAKKDSVIDGKNIIAGDILIGLPSSGVHSNGFSLVRSVLEQSGLSLKGKLPGGDITIAEALMAPTVIYVKQVLDLVSKGGVKGIAHITGGGFTENIPRVFPEGLGALIYKDSWEVPIVFKWLQEAGNIQDSEMRRTFNMGIGMVLVVSPEAANRILDDVEKAYRIGEVISDNDKGITYG
ncbi:phosphoribosylformylglycinamidine cyclo-ligase, chloroplastic/mitochondrial-like isoform X2 [Trifolium pratense]|uniref:phosphoribosylformylglycinamidine cyclo-ligase n=1 Tax=Trifolium pratense TaxID=57577 RepID=Q2PET3_TRIPR|nr:phosphoribosylformylglycinamidine cyclo-ligase, chloroplastic/mitochondrial-like isoform X2 [Trifolium pratense]XP_045816948.1 phosphoribosylformylglycinamidine cyclo-ligase, chloroplastic/mitochondrial-like isoform X2 [Trifolium pratense]XP_045816958.1 phosphoribosylformylglycinamidine cyclo-ligase, chloroplastic/mitochondrial-like isoform X2 [Trifolium pratense]BAE71269.1 putative phosphoribosylformylglycinamidine cyclo-ligase precursor [Trifolium pratense]